MICPSRDVHNSSPIPTTTMLFSESDSISRRRKRVSDSSEISADVLQEMKRGRFAPRVRFAPQEPAVIPSCHPPITPQEMSLTWYSMAECQSFRQDIVATIQAFHRAERDVGKLPGHFCLRGLESHLTYRSAKEHRQRRVEHTRFVVRASQQAQATTRHQSLCQASEKSSMASRKLAYRRGKLDAADFSILQPLLGGGTRNR